jgi:hypothetical protein
MWMTLCSRHYLPGPTVGCLAHRVATQVYLFDGPLRAKRRGQRFDPLGPDVAAAQIQYLHPGATEYCMFHQTLPQETLPLA